MKGTIIEKLRKIQQELKAPKGQYNAFGKYKYRNVEDILEAVKPLLKEHECVLLMNDTIENIGDRFYVKTIARLADSDGDIITQAYAREEQEKKGMDGSQITGASSSYARKYALNGLFAIDDTKDSDTTNEGVKEEKKPSFDKTEIDKITDMEELKEYYKKNEGKGKDFASYVLARKKILQSVTMNKDENNK